MKTAKNDITGDLIASRMSNEKYNENYDTIFTSKPELVLGERGESMEKCGKRCWLEYSGSEFKCNKPNCTKELS